MSLLTLLLIVALVALLFFVLGTKYGRSLEAGVQAEKQKLLLDLKAAEVRLESVFGKHPQPGQPASSPAAPAAAVKTDAPAST